MIRSFALADECASGPGVIASDQLALLGMQEDRPLVPRRIECALEFLDAIARFTSV